MSDGWFHQLGPQLHPHPAFLHTFFSFLVLQAKCRSTFECILAPPTARFIVLKPKATVADMFFSDHFNTQQLCKLRSIDLSSQPAASNGDGWIKREPFGPEISYNVIPVRSAVTSRELHSGRLKEYLCKCWKTKTTKYWGRGHNPVWIFTSSPAFTHI